MTTRFIAASDLKKQYDVLGHFYSLVMDGADPLKCRSVLEIKSKDAPQAPEADAVFVMMNPGSSRPITEGDVAVGVDRVSEMASLLVPTVPDTTQYQVMRVMHHVGWNHVRVINLSDIRDPKSGSFCDRYLQFEQQAGCEIHSVFSSGRSEELKQHLSRKPNAPIVCAWGVDDSLEPLIDRATSRLSAASGGAGVTGVAKTAVPGRYFHPLPMLQRQKEEWVVKMLQQLGAY